VPCLRCCWANDQAVCRTYALLSQLAAADQHLSRGVRGIARDGACVVSGGGILGTVGKPALTRGELAKKIIKDQAKDKIQEKIGEGP
jgi:hypothetical protein